MSTARESAVRLLQLMMIASVVLPTALFAYASWVSYRDISAVADERIFRSLDVMQEQSLKVFETVDRTFAEVNEIVRGMSDKEIHAAGPRLHQRLASIVATMPQLHAILLVGRGGRPLVASTLAAVPDSVNFSDRDYFQTQLERDAGTYVGDMRSPRLPGISSDFFDLSRRLESPDGAFNGVIAVAVRPSYFEDFYGLVGQTPGSFFALVRADGAYLARYPVAGERLRWLSPASRLRTAIGDGLDHGLFTVDSEVDGVSRRVGFRKLAGFPVYALAGTTSAAIEAQWLSHVRAYLIVGLPATLVVLAVLWIALRRTRRLYQEADRREVAEGALRQAQTAPPPSAAPRSRCCCREASKRRPRSARRRSPPPRRRPPARCCWSRTMPTWSRLPALISPSLATASPWLRARKRASISSPAKTISISSSPTY